MSDKSSENSDLSTVEIFCQDALRDHISPPRLGSVKSRIRHAARLLGWSYTRTRDAWYADPKISISGKELAMVEQISGLEYGRKEYSSVDELIAKADALLDGPQADFHRPFVAAFRAFISALDRA